MVKTSFCHPCQPCQSHVQIPLCTKNSIALMRWVLCKPYYARCPQKFLSWCYARHISWAHCGHFSNISIFGNVTQNGNVNISIFGNVTKNCNVSSQKMRNEKSFFCKRYQFFSRYDSLINYFLLFSSVFKTKIPYTCPSLKNVCSCGPVHFKFMLFTLQAIDWNTGCWLVAFT